jgi:hypothetical protein
MVAANKEAMEPRVNIGEDVGSETSVNDSVQTNKMINKHLKCSTTTPKKDVKI